MIRIKTERVTKVWEQNEVIAGLSSPITAMERADVLHCDEGLRINCVNLMLNVVNVSTFDAAADHRHSPVFPMTREFGYSIASITDGLCDGLAAA